MKPKKNKKKNKKKLKFVKKRYIEKIVHKRHGDRG